jgi:hypothetical protein
MNAIELVPYNSFIYNAADKDTNPRGSAVINNKIVKNKVCLIYSVYKIENGIAFCQSKDAHGMIYKEQLPIKNLKPFACKDKKR